MFSAGDKFLIQCRSVQVKVGETGYVEAMFTPRGDEKVEGAKLSEIRKDLIGKSVEAVWKSGKYARTNNIKHGNAGIFDPNVKKAAEVALRSLETAVVTACEVGNDFVFRGFEPSGSVQTFAANFGDYDDSPQKVRFYIPYQEGMTPAQISAELMLAAKKAESEYGKLVGETD
ncbi:MAG: hypothetical protein A3I05_09025 [Deltaproteobacteria bacterium RIFCSPLOWO2_02_FULL_44_10]|nr:MAG: hypothetical protein A3C46_08590 [Deltaproteobacteria bacterium RIFCSPHIGHO2_02_FULL_44_16]OGQ45247.1 MAG: hypothetical protein A3I05_09025 [Deltaproteobacteria bacterium RIFCSPLOWO2_02_FULL_44_10]